jgi:hypothetical protein
MQRLGESLHFKKRLHTTIEKKKKKEKEKNKEPH